MEIEELINYLLTPATQVLIIMAIAELIKRLELFDKKYIPVLDLVLGLLSGVIVFGIILGHPILVSVIIGIALGLSACGLFSGIKNVSE
jgi:hypothetical protein